MSQKSKCTKLAAKSAAYHPFILCLLGLLIYFPIFKAPFCFDDQIVIINNPLIQDLSLGWQGVKEVWAFQHSRFLTNLSFAINFYFYQLETFNYHLVNFIIHLLTVAGIWFLTNLVLKIKKVKPQLEIGWWAALLFLVHPLNTEAVSYIGQRSSSLVALFYLWSVIFYIQGRTENKIQHFFGALFFSILALLSKETAMTLPLAWMLVDYFIFNRLSPKWVWGSLALMIFVVIVFFDFHWKEILFTPIYSQSHRNDLLTPYTYLLTQIRVLVVLFSLITFPIGLNVDYDFAMSHGLFELPVLCSFAFLAVLIGVAFKVRKSYWAFSFAVFWFFVSLLPHIFPPRGNVIAEHKLYLTLILFIPLVCYGLYQIVSPKTFKIVLSILIAVFSCLTFYRNTLWAQPIELWQNTITSSPHKARPYLNLAISYYQNGNFEQALKAYQEVIELAPEIPQPYVDSSEIYYRQGKSKEAMEYAQKGIAVNPNEFLPYLQRGILLARRNEKEAAVVDFNKAFSLNPQLREIRKMRGMLLFELHRDAEALEDDNVWLHWYPRDETVLNQRSDIYFRRKEYHLALLDYDQLVNINPKGVYYYNRSVLHQILGHHGQMLQDRQMADSLGFKH
jgi:tetratricopeptide (TPR) repeat protein